jgi:hypothetical protein
MPQTDWRVTCLTRRPINPIRPLICANRGRSQQSGVTKVVLTMIAFAVVVIGIVALKSWVWIPHLTR